MKLRFIFSTILLLTMLGLSQAAPEAIKGLITGDQATSSISAKLLASHPPDSLAVWIRNFNDFPAPATTGWAVELRHQINDTLVAPAWLYIPTSYNPQIPTPFVISLHGGVSGAKFRDASTKNWHDESVIQIAEAEGWLVLYPLGMTGCAWWDKTGMENILWYVREMKRLYNVDDDRVAMCGFSDGASGSYHFAMLAATDFAVFFPWSGHPSVGTQVGGIQTYLENLQARPLFASNGGKDQLYPAAKLDPFHRLILSTGSLLSVSYCDTAGHNYGYMPEEWSRMAVRFERHARDPYPSEIYFETADLEFSSLDWLKISTLDTTRSAAWWYGDLNLKETDDRISIGFNPDQDYDGKGVRLGFVSADPESPAVKAGMKAGDILIQIDDVKVVGMADVVLAKEGRKRGDPITLTFNRGSEKMKFETSYPPIQEYDAFPRNLKSGAVIVRRVGNSFEIQGSRVASCEISLSPDMIRFEEPVRVAVTERTHFFEAHNAIVKPSSTTLLDQFQKDHDRIRLVYAKLKLDIPKK